MRIVITGASGLIGTQLTKDLVALGHTVEPYSFPRPAVTAESPQDWHDLHPKFDPKPFLAADAIINLAGENIKGIWTKRKKARISNSRAIPLGWIANTIASKEGDKPVLLSASAVGYYGEQGDADVSEHTPNGDIFLSHSTRDWEAATQPALAAGGRVVIMRLGVVLSPDGGALKAMLPAFKLGLGGTMGSGDQWMSWISLPDASQAMIFCLNQSDVAGPVNVVAPDPVKNSEFTKTLGTVLHRPTFMNVPASVLKATLGTMAEETILTSCKVHPVKLQEHKFNWQHPKLNQALEAVLK